MSGHGESKKFLGVVIFLCAAVALWLQPASAVAASIDSPHVLPAQSNDFDTPFQVPQYLIHETGYGTTSGPVTVDRYVLWIEEPDANGFFRTADGFAGTI